MMAKSTKVEAQSKSERRRTTVWLPMPTYNQLRHLAVDENRDQQDIIADALVMYFERQKTSKK